VGLFCLLHSLCVSEPFAALPPLRIAELYIAFAMPINAHLCPCLSKQSARYYAVANPCFTSPLPRDLCFTLPLPRQSRPRRAAHSPRVAYPSLSIAKHSIPCRREARLFFAFARHIKSLQCRCHELHSKAFAYPALQYQAFASLEASGAFDAMKSRATFSLLGHVPSTGSKNVNLTFICVSFLFVCS
jgi:hypothetical protein